MMSTESTVCGSILCAREESRVRTANEQLRVYEHTAVREVWCPGQFRPWMSDAGEGPKGLVEGRECTYSYAQKAACSSLREVKGSKTRQSHPLEAADCIKGSTFEFGLTVDDKRRSFQPRSSIPLPLPLPPRPLFNRPLAAYSSSTIWDPMLVDYDHDSARHSNAVQAIQCKAPILGLGSRSLVLGRNVCLDAKRLLAYA
ncbi:hypothetical protein CC1G_15262 [Coprinopsis cinerea okayama7|uniref:Uncharacterized protein n=1 Tax=Coprinopsis cinerea (strain Okayama-7 / 130 / ATCC MYA-4618 / FGSC 9003) TaxID=240176 RepID=D6RPW1_COPC7|nr:hypothetical protein CC1G_15262 [Coprinopsis cinerea okayama7\|eukprot:XP_002910354.1 hypothetical protein CC1G_15262 [Coprinopsis cinerea okayama7\